MQLGSNWAFSQVTANFSANTTSGCGSLITGFSNLSTGSVTSWQWDFGNGNTSTLANPGITYSNPGIYTVSLIVSDGTNFDTLIRANYIQVFQLPIASFSVNQAIGCLPLAINLSNTSTAGSAAITTNTWDFGDGSGASSVNATHVYNSAGTYNPVLFVTDANGCTASTSAGTTIQVLPDLAANFSVDTNRTCGFPFAVQFSDNSTGPGPFSYAWDFGDGNSSALQNPSHNYLVGGDKDVQLIVSNSSGCADTLLQIGLIQEDSLQANFTSIANSGCEFSSIQFQNTSAGNASTWLWDFGDGTTSTLQNPSHIYSLAGNYAVRLIAWNALGCSDTLLQNNFITIFGSPTASFTVSNNQACEAPLLANFTQTGSGATSYAWDFGDGTSSTLPSPNHNYTSTGQFDVTLVATNAQGCRDTFVQSNAVQIIPPVANFTSVTVQNGCRPLLYKFDDASTTAFDSINSHNWDFGDGGSSTLASPNYNYNSYGSFTVTYIVGTTGGCFDTLVLPNYVTISTQPTASFTVSDLNPCFGDLVQFTNTTSGSTTNYNWSFGNGDTSTATSPSYIFPDTGCYNVNLFAGNGGCIDSLNTPVQVCVKGVKPAFSMSQSSSCTFPVNVNFTNLSQGNNLKYLWDFGDGTTSSLPSPNHTFTSIGVFVVNLFAEDTIANCSFNQSETFSVGLPLVNFGVNQTNGCSDLTINFTDSTAAAAAWAWDFGDGGTSTSQAPSHTYVNGGNFTVSLTVTDSGGCSDTRTISNMITVYENAAAFNATRRPACIGESINFSDLSSSNGTLSSWLWDFGDGTTATASNPSHSYANAGNYHIQLISTDNNGCTDTLIKYDFIRIIQPLAAFGQSAGNLCPGELLTLSDSSAGLPPRTNSWRFGDGNTSALANPTHVYGIQGNLMVELIVADSAGCADTAFSPITVERPVAAFTVSDSLSSCPPLNVAFTQTSTGNIAAYEWHFGDGASAALPNPSHVYTTTDSFDVSLIVSTPSGCSDTLFYPARIQITPPNGSFSFSQTAGCIGQELQFILASNGNVSPIWDFGDGNLVFAGDTVLYTYMNAGNYTPIVTVIDSAGCQNSIAASNNLRIFSRPIADATISKTLLCPGDSVVFNDNSTFTTPLSSLSWDFGNGNTGNNVSQAESYVNPGFYTLSLAITDTLGCSDTIVMPNVLRVFGMVPALNISPLTACANTPTSFYDASSSDTTILQWAWDFGDSTTGTGDTTFHSYLNTGSYGVSLVVTDALGCQDSIVMNNVLNVVAPTGSFYFAPENICRHDSVQFTLLTDSTNTPTWYFGNGDSLQGNFDFWHRYDSANVFTPQVLLTDTTGCTALIPLAGNIQVFALPDASIWTDRSQLCRYDTLILADSTFYPNPPGTVNWEFGDGNTAVGASTSHSYTNSGYHTIVMNVTDAYGCKGTDTLLDVVKVLRVTADFGANATTICIPQDVIFSDSSTGDTTIVAWSWDFGDGTTGTGNPIAHTYTSNGIFDVTLVVVDAGGCSDTVQYRKFIDARLPEVPTIYAVSVAGDDLVAINVQPTTNPLFDYYEVHVEVGPSYYYYTGYSSNINNGLIFDNQNNTLYASVCYRALMADTCGNVTDLDSARTHCTIDLTAIPGNHAIDLFWNNYVGWDTILSYNIWAVTDYDTSQANVQWIGSVAGNVTAFTDSSFQCNVHRTYRVQAIGALPQHISWSDTSGADPIQITSPAAPELVVATVSNNADIQIEWNQGSLPNVMSYDLERSLDNVAWTLLGNFGSTTTQYLDQQASVASQSYYYRVSGIDSCGLPSLKSNLGQSILLLADASGNDPVLQWNAYQEWDSIDHYEIEARPTQGGNWIQLGSVSASTTSFVDAQGIAGAESVCYRVRAIEDGGNQAVSLSNEVCVSAEIWIPNTLTPNSDGFNDVWIIKGLSGFPNSAVSIYNRWGNIVYESTDYQNNWNGTNAKTKEVLPDGTYFFVLKISEDQTYKGQVTLMR